MGKDSLGLGNVGLGRLARVHWCRSESRHARTVRPPRLIKSRGRVLAARNSLPPSVRTWRRAVTKILNFWASFCVKMAGRLSASERPHQGHSGGVLPLVGPAGVSTLIPVSTLQARVARSLWSPSPFGKSWILHWCTDEAFISIPQCTSSRCSPHNQNSLSLWLDMTTIRTDIGKARKKMFAKTNNELATADPANRGSTIKGQSTKD